MDGADFVSTDEDGKVPVSSKNRVDRALLHLGFLEQEIQGLLNDVKGLAKIVRTTAAQQKQQFDGELPTWPPLKVIRFILLRAQQEAVAREGGAPGTS